MLPQHFQVYLKNIVQFFLDILDIPPVFNQK